MSYRRIETRDGFTVMNKELYDNLQDGIEYQFFEGVGSRTVMCNNSKKGGLLLNKVFGKSTQATPSPSSPQEVTKIGAKGSIDLRVTNENLIKLPTKTHEVNGITYIFGNYGTVTVNGTLTSTSSTHQLLSLKLPVGNYFLKGCPKGGSGSTYRIQADVYYKDGTVNYYPDTGSGVMFTVKEGITSCSVSIIIASNVNYVTFNPMLSLSDEERDFVIGDYSPITLSTSNGLGSLVTLNTSASNFIDKNGQMFICDEIDLERGVCVQRIKELILKGTESWEISGSYFALKLGDFDSVISDAQMSNYLGSGNSFSGLRSEIHVYNSTTNNRAQLCLDYSSDITTVSELKSLLAEKYANGVPVKVYYALSTPIETPLTQSEFISVLNLKSYEGVTNIIGSEDFGISAQFPTTDCAGITGLSYNMVRRLNASYEILNATVE